MKHLLTAVLAAALAIGAYNLPGCATTRKLTPAQSTAATPAAITAQADNAAETGKTLGATANAAHGHALAIVAASSVSDAAATSAAAAAPVVAPQVATIHKANTAIRTEASGIQTNAGTVAAAADDVFDYAKSLQNANAALDKLSAERDQAKAERDAALGRTATFLLWCAAALGAATVALLAALFFSPFKPPMLAPVATGALAALCLALAGAWVGFVGWAVTHGPWIVGALVVIVTILALVALFVHGYFTKAVGYAESLKTAVLAKAPAMGATIAAVGEQAAATTGPIAGTLLASAENKWVKIKAWEHRTLHRNAKHLAAAHLDAVAALADAVPVVPVAVVTPAPAIIPTGLPNAAPATATVATPGATITTVTTTAPVSVTGP